MKKILISLCLVFCAVLSYAQLTPVPRGNANQIDQFRGVIQGVRGTIITPVDTTGNPLTTYYGALTVLPNDVNKDTIPIWMSNGFKWIRFSGGNGTNINDTIYTRAPVAVDRTTIPGKQIIYLLHLDGIVSPGYVVWTGMGLNFNVTPADYYIGYRQFFSSANLLTLAAAPVSNSRVDLFIVDTTATASVLTGTPGIGAAAPQTNPSSQLPLTTVTVNVGDTVPAGIALETIYNDHIAPPTEWLATTNGSIAADFDNTVNPYIGTKAIFVSTYANGSNITFTKGSGVDTVKAGEIVRGFVSFNIPFTSQFQFQWFNGATPVSNSIAINSGYGINPNNVNNYQIFAIPLNAWNFTPASQGIYNKLVITMGGNDISGAGGFYMDYLQLQTGLINSTPDDFLDSVYARNDSLFQYKHGIEMYRGKFSGGGGSVTADNGLTVNTGSNVQWGGTLIQPVEITENVNPITIHGGNFSIDNHFIIDSASQNYRMGDLLGTGNETYMHVDDASSAITFNGFSEPFLTSGWRQKLALPQYRSGGTGTTGFIPFVVSDTSKYKPLVIDTLTGEVSQSHWYGSGGGTGIDSIRKAANSDSIKQYSGGTGTFAVRATRVFNVKDYGAKGDSLTDDTQSIQNAINACNTAGGGTVYFPDPAIYYRIHGALQVSSNSQLLIPESPASSVLRNHITLMGESRPNFIPTGGGLSAGAASVIAIKTTRLVSDLGTGATGAAVIGTGGTFNETFLSVENLAIQVRNNPAGGGPVVGGISYKNGGSLQCRNVVVYIDTSGYRSTAPTNDIAGIETPDNNAESFNNLENTLVVGFRSGYKIGEHTTLNQANAWCCYYGFYIKQSYHNITAMRAVAHWCSYDIYVRDFCTLANFNIDVEWQQIGKWYDDIATIKDSANNASGEVYYTIIAAGVGVDNTKFSKSGGASLNTWSHASGPNSSVAGYLLNESSSTSSNLITLGSLTSGAVNNSMGMTAAGRGTAPASGSGAYFIMRGNTWSGSAQRGNVYISAGGPTTPLTGEGQIHFATGAFDADRMVIDKNGDVTTGSMKYDATNVRLGVGVTTPLAPLHVKSASVSAFGQLTLQDVTSAGNASIIYETYYDNAATRLVVMGLGHYGGGTDPDYYFANEIASGGVTFRNSSANTFKITNAGILNLPITPSTNSEAAPALLVRNASSGNFEVRTSLAKLSIATGSNASIGVSGAMTAGTITISTTSVTASSKIFLTTAVVGGTVGVLSVGTIIAGTSFVINSSSALDTSTVNWWIIN